MKEKQRADRARTQKLRAERPRTQIAPEAPFAYPVRPEAGKKLCPQFGRCGGCQLLSLPYEEQLSLKQGYLERQDIPEDRRKCRLVCTDKAAPVIRRGRAVQETFSRQLTEGLTPEELEICFRCFTVFGENMTRLTDCRGASQGGSK